MAREASAWGEKMAKEASAAADKASSKLQEVAEQAKVRVQPPIQVGPYRVSKVKKLADGGFSEVFLAQDASGGDEQFALKRMVCQTPGAKTDAKAELRLLKSFGKHPNDPLVTGGGGQVDGRLAVLIGAAVAVVVHEVQGFFAAGEDARTVR